MRSGFGHGVLGHVAFGMAGGVAVDHAGFDGPVHGGGVGDAGGLGRGGVAAGGSPLEFFLQGLEVRLDGAVARGEAERLAGGFDGGFGVGHDGKYVRSRSKTQTPAVESSVFCLR